MLRWYNDSSLKHARMSLHDCSGSRRRQQKKEAKCPATHMNSFHPSLFALLASHGAVAEKKTDIKGDKHAQAKAMRRRKSSSLRKRGEGGEEMERKGRREGEREGGGRTERHGERIPSQIGLGQFVVTKKKKEKGKRFLARQQETMFGRRIHTAGYCSYTDTQPHAREHTPHKQMRT